MLRWWPKASAAPLSPDSPAAQRSKPSRSCFHRILTHSHTSTQLIDTLDSVYKSWPLVTMFTKHLLHAIECVDFVLSIVLCTRYGPVPAFHVPPVFLADMHTRGQYTRRLIICRCIYGPEVRMQHAHQESFTKEARFDLDLGDTCTYFFNIWKKEGSFRWGSGLSKVQGGSNRGLRSPASQSYGD